MSKQHVAVVVPVLNEEAALDALIEQLLSALDERNYSWSVLFVDDGSTDGTLAKLKKIHTADPRFTAISFSRNFGKESAIAAGLNYAWGDAVILMDADLQHPPRLIPTFIERWREGYKLVFAKRQSRSSRHRLRDLYSQTFHTVFSRVAQRPLPIGTVDFLLMDRQAVDVINRLGERTRFSKGFYGWIGFPSVQVPFVCEERSVGDTRWSFFKLARFAADGLISFSSLPLKVWSYIGALISLISLTYATYFMVRTLLFDTDVPGFPSLFVAIMFFAGLQLISLGVIGEYLARVYEEVKARPLYVVAERIGLEREEGATVQKSARRVG
jgi:glycosyltransferase involved in cell wall biosynthesis